MPRKSNRFPIALRAAVVALALVAGLVGAAPPGAAAAPTAQQVHDAKARVDALIHQMKQAQATLDGINKSLLAASAEVDRQEGQLEKLNADLAATQRSLQGTRAHYDAIIGQLNERATQAFMDGGTSNLDFILGATSLGDLSDRIEFVNAVAQSDESLAQDVANTRNQLEADLSALVDLRAQQRDAVAQASAARRTIDAAFKAEQRTVDYIASKKAEAERIARTLSASYRAWLSRQTSGGGYGGGHPGVPMPPGWGSVLQRCPVDGPRGYTDGFGAPRYTGGYHLHGGVDIMAPRGIPIVAPFNGTAQRSSSGLGGNEVYVYGQYGYAFNAHLSSYSSLSDGVVSAGDVIGYVGDTGDAVGTHDHFEFHPSVLPDNWPTSPFGYSVIGTAIDPYPLLVAVCG